MEKREGRVSEAKVVRQVGEGNGVGDGVKGCREEHTDETRIRGDKEFISNSLGG